MNAVIDDLIEGVRMGLIERKSNVPHFKVKGNRNHHLGAYKYAEAQEALALSQGRARLRLRELESACHKLDIEPFSERVHDKDLLKSAPALTTMQVNVGYACNLACTHCYLECDSTRAETMSRETMEDVLAAFRIGGFTTLDITGGSPEMNPHLEWLIEQAAPLVTAAGHSTANGAGNVGADTAGANGADDARSTDSNVNTDAGTGSRNDSTEPRMFHVKHSGAADDAADGESAGGAGAGGAGDLIVRSNLAILDMPEYRHLADVYARNKVHIVTSLPYFNGSECDAQRGRHTFERIIKVIRRLNELGYGEDPALKLDLAYNVNGPFLPPDQRELEEYYAYELEREQGVKFNNLYAFNNYALGRFAALLKREGKFDYYLNLLSENYNAAVVARMMCRTQVNVDWDGSLMEKYAD